MVEDLEILQSPVTDQDIEWVCSVMRLPNNAFAGKDGNDPRLSVLRSLDTLDIEACPGSGKTTLLVAKLAILANRWNSRRQGICVLSHTNAARIEIGDRLSSTSAGHLILHHPHFVGTIHSFVNEFLAVPWLRSQGRAIKAIDNALAQKDRWQRLAWGTQRYLEQQHVIPSLTYTQPDYTGNGFPSHTETHKKIQRACRQSSEAGYYRFDEMFVWANELIECHPSVIETIRERFPLLFLDEIQDNSELQSEFLHRLFMKGENPVVRQRFGDSNQAIYHRSGATGAVTDAFPGAYKVDLPNSFRFGQTIADLAAPLGVKPQALIGRGPTSSRIKQESGQNALFLFDDESILSVLPAYAEYLIASFTPEALRKGDFTAVSGVHRAEKDDHLPRFMGHYALNYDPEIAGKQPKPNSLAQYIARARLEIASSPNTSHIANYFAEGILHFIRLAGKEMALGLRKSANRHLLELLSTEAAQQEYLLVLDKIISCRCELSRADWEIIATTAQALGESVTGELIEEQDALDFLNWSEVDLCDKPDAEPRKTLNIFEYPPRTPKVSIRLGSIHGVKGETHTATLVLESFQHAHHLKKLLPWLVGKKPKAGSDNSGENTALLERLKLHYVAMTRASHVLCLAMRKDTFTPAQLDLMRARNWCVIECTKPAI